MEGGNHCLSLAIVVYINATLLEYRLKKDATRSKNMGRFGPGLVRPGRFGLMLGVVDSALKVSRLGPEWFRLWAGLIKCQ